MLHKIKIIIVYFYLNIKNLNLFLLLTEYRKYKKDKDKLLSIKKNIKTKLSKNNKNFFIIGMNGIENIKLSLPMLLALVYSSYKPIVIFFSYPNFIEKKIYRALGIKNFITINLTIANYIRNVNCNICENKNSISSLSKLKYKNVAVGQLALSNLMRRIRSGDLDESNYTNIKTLKKLILSSVSVIDKLESDIARYMPAGGIFIDRGYIPEGLIFNLLIQKNLDCITWNASHKDNALVLKRYNSKNVNNHFSSLSDESWQQIQKVSFDKNKSQQILDEVFNAYLTGEWYSEVGTQFKTKIYDKKELISKLNLDTNKKIILLFPHIFWDATFFWGIDLFKNYQVWFESVINQLKNNKNIHVLIKVHPANIVKNARDGVNDIPSELDSINKMGKLPSNMTLIMPDTDISTYNLFMIGDVCLTVRGTVGIEASMLGIPTITAGTGRYDQKGFTIDPKNIDEYNRALQEIHSLSKLSSNKKILAQKFAYGVFINRIINTETINFLYSRDDKASLDVRIIETDLAKMKDVQRISEWFQSGKEDYFL